MADEHSAQIPKVKLGNQGLKVSKLGFGCMGLSGVYNDPVQEEVGISIIKYAFSKGITFFDSADVYGANANEVLVGKALKQLPREKIQLATKFGIVKMEANRVTVNGTPEYVRSCCEGSLKRLDVGYIDLYYQHRVDTSVPIEETKSPPNTQLREKTVENKNRMADEHSAQIPKVKLGNQGLEVSKLGFGCMGLSGVYNDPVQEEVGISIIKYAFSKGITFFDSADVYGANANEVLVGKALKQLPREKIQLATKFGIVKMEANRVTVNGTPEYVRSCCEGSLKRLDVDYIDLYYQHRVDTSVPIEDTIGELKKLVEEGKINYIGLSEASADTIRRAHAVHPITAVQMEWSLWTREIEEEIIPLCSFLYGYMPKCTGSLELELYHTALLVVDFFGGKAVIESIPANSFLNANPRFQGENFDQNKTLYFRLVKFAEKHGCTPAQLALAWILHQGDDVVPIPGTTKIKNLDDNIGSIRVNLCREDVKEISDIIPVNVVAGDRISDNFIRCSWKFANTPSRDSKVA
nr:putative aldo-keto reductase 1 [Quercus suber]